MLEVHLGALVVHATTREPLAILVEQGTDRCVVVTVRHPQAEVMVQGPHPARDEDTRLTQDLVADMAAAVGRRVDRAELIDLVDSRFHAELVLDDGTRVRARPSDALAVAVRDDLTVLVADHVLDGVGQSFAALWPADRPREPYEQVRQMREFLDEVTPDDFGRPP